jgi:hypothetical protein
MTIRNWTPNNDHITHKKILKFINYYNRVSHMLTFIFLLEMQNEIVYSQKIIKILKYLLKRHWILWIYNLKKTQSFYRQNEIIWSHNRSISIFFWNILGELTLYTWRIILLLCKYKWAEYFFHWSTIVDKKIWIKIAILFQNYCFLFSFLATMQIVSQRFKISH